MIDWLFVDLTPETVYKGITVVTGTILAALGLKGWVDKKRAERDARWGAKADKTQLLALDQALSDRLAVHKGEVMALDAAVSERLAVHRRDIDKNHAAVLDIYDKHEETRSMLGRQYEALSNHLIDISKRLPKL